MTPAEAFSETKRLIIERTGHFYFADKDEALFDRVRRRMRARGLPSVADYLAFLRSQDGEGEWEALEAEITIGETFFFRFAEQFAALRDQLLPAILQANASTRRVRVWSAGCSSGAETYSVGILLHDLLGPALPDWRITVIGTDLNARAVAAARAAVFGAWALRGMSPADRDRYFLPEQAGRWSLRPHYRALARFQQHNLMSLLDAPPPVQFTEFDLILCRNVLIYFHPETAVAVAAALARCLAPDRWILFGHAEAALATAAGLVETALPGTMVYRRGDAAAERGPAQPVRPQPCFPPPGQTAAPAWQPLLPPPAPMQTASAPLAPAAPGPAAAPASAASGVAAAEEVRALADRGDIDAALALCRRLSAADPMSARLHFYEGMLLHEAGADEAAVNALRRAVYLRKDHALAHYYLGLALLRIGQTGPARRAIAVAVSQAACEPQEATVEDGDGMTAGDLASMARHYLESIAVTAS
jgi:chemotaxis protein methyltransferase CheR